MSGRALFRPVRRGAVKVDLPDTRQVEDFTCGASCFQAIAGYFGALRPDDEEADIVSVMGIARDCGAHPHHVIRGIRHYRLQWREHFDMTVGQVKAYVDAGKPVMMMVQAWRSIDRRRRRVRGYVNEWNEGHWIAAIGYDSDVMYFEDPSLAVVRGFMTLSELEQRWHDVGPYWVKPYKRHMANYGIAIWRDPARKPLYPVRAARIQ